MTKEPEKLVESIVHYSMEKSEADRLQSYLDRGRAFGNHTQEALENAYVDAMAGWAKNVRDKRANTRTSDLTAEFTLRSAEPPLERARALLDIITSEIVKHVRNLPEERQEEINEEIIDDYFDDLEHRN